MDDINFDELDKAVHTALQQRHSNPSSFEATSTSQSDDDQHAVDDSDSAIIQEETVTNPGNDNTPTDIAPKHRGHFMDIVHPSSDMALAPDHRGTMPRHDGVLQPLDSSIVEMSQGEAQHQNASHDETENNSSLPVVPSVAQKQKEEQHLEIARSLQPDEQSAPIDYEHPVNVPEAADYTNDGQGTPFTDESTQDQADIQSDQSSFIKPTVSVPSVDGLVEESSSVTPFVAGATVEKRPLGAFAAAVHSPSTTLNEAVKEAVSEDSSPEEDTEKTEEASPEVGETLLLSDESQEEAPPQELTPEVVSVESDAVISHSEQAPELQDEITSHASAVAASISPQYKAESPTTENEESHSVFDTKEYHQPLTPPAKKRHTVLVILLVIVLIAIIGAGTWYALVML